MPHTQSAKEIPELNEIISMHEEAIQIINNSPKRNEKKYKVKLFLLVVESGMYSSICLIVIRQFDQKRQNLTKKPIIILLLLFFLLLQVALLKD